jgi:hypothetical protein
MIFKIMKKAQKTGGDKYVCIDDESFVIYIPQSISRANGQVKNALSIIIE